MQQIFTFVVVASLGLTLCNGDLKSAEVSRPCLMPPAPVFPHIDFSWLFSERPSMHVSMGSQYMFRSHSEFLRGKSASDSADLSKIDLKISLASGMINTTGHGEFFEQFCRPDIAQAVKKGQETPESASSDARVRCFPGAHSAMTSPSFVSIQTTMVWTDNSTAVMLARCVRLNHKDNFGDWSLLSVSPTVSEEVKKQVMAKAAELGLDTNSTTV